MARTPINYYFEIEHCSSAFWAICHFQCPESICKCIYVRVLCVPVHTHSSAVPVRPFSNFFRDFKIGSTAPMLRRLKVLGSRMVWGQGWLGSFGCVKHKNALGGTVLGCDELCNRTAVPGLPKILCLVSHLDSLQLPVRKMHNSHDLLYVSPQIPLGSECPFCAWSIRGFLAAFCGLGDMSYP